MNDMKQATHEQAMAVLQDAPVFQVWYLGAFSALGIQNAPISRELADLTRSIDEATAACAIMGAARSGDRVWPALEFLRARRKDEEKRLELGVIARGQTP